jgi:hypothetical protein
VTAPSNVGLYRRATAAALVLGPLLFLLDNLLHPKEYKRDHEAQQLAKIGDAYTRWQLAHTIGFLALIVFAAAILGLAFMVRRRQPTLGLVAGALGVVGLLGAAGVFAIDGYTWGVLGEVSTKPGVDQHTVEVALNTVQKSNWSLAWYLLLPVWIAGVVLLAIGAGATAVSLPGRRCCWHSARSRSASRRSSRATPTSSPAQRSGRPVASRWPSRSRA